MKCPKCNHSRFEKKKIRVTPKVRNKPVEIVVPLHVCKMCETPLMSTEEINTIRRAATDKYRDLHHLLTSQQIIQYREAFKMSQSAFANYLGVGEASIKRWETYYIQDNSQDSNIRVKCDSAYASLNLLNIEYNVNGPDIYTGWKNFSLELLKEMIVFYLKRNCTHLSLLAKIHFYADFLHFKKHKKGITGMKYLPYKLGPFPYQYNLILRVFDKREFIQKENEILLAADLDPNLTLFSEDEKATLQRIADLCKEPSFKELPKQEPAYIHTEDNNFISYKHAAKLLVS